MNFGFEPTPVTSLRLPTQCNVPGRVNYLNLPKEKMTWGRIRTPTMKDFQNRSPVSYHCATLRWVSSDNHFSI